MNAFEAATVRPAFAARDRVLRVVIGRGKAARYRVLRLIDPGAAEAFLSGALPVYGKGAKTDAKGRAGEVRASVSAFLRGGAPAVDFAA